MQSALLLARHPAVRNRSGLTPAPEISIAYLRRAEGYCRLQPSPLYCSPRKSFARSNIEELTEKTAAISSSRERRECVLSLIEAGETVLKPRFPLNVDVGTFTRRRFRSRLCFRPRTAGLGEQQGATPPDTYRYQMWKRIRQGAHRSRYRLRKVVVEPVFGQIKQARGFRQFLLRGLHNVSGEWALVCTAHNILKLAGARG